MENKDLENKDLENKDLENKDLENKDLENKDLEVKHMIETELKKEEKPKVEKKKKYTGDLRGFKSYEDAVNYPHTEAFSKLDKGCQNEYKAWLEKIM